MFKKIIYAIGWRLKTSKARQYKVGDYSITLPAGHKLDLYQESYKNYDRKLPIIAELTESKYGAMSIIDIGANIGDTAVALRGVCSAPIVCVEGNSDFLPLLAANLSKLPGVFRIIPKYIGLESDEGVRGVITSNGTAHIKREVETSLEFTPECTFSVTTYDEMIGSNSDLPEPRLVKIDTDGFDFKIIMTSLCALSKNKPILFFEFDPSFSPINEKHEATKTLNCLNEVGYVHYIIFDNFGNYMVSFSGNQLNIFSDLLFYLEQSRYNGGGINYLDICCFSADDQDIFARFVADEQKLK